MTLLGWLIAFIALLYFDLRLFHSSSQEITTRKSLLLTALWIALALLFNLYIFWDMGQEKGLQFFAGYLIEKSLSIDNLFVFVILFKKFHIPSHLHHRVLFYGIFGALFFRLIMILIGTELITAFSWVTYLFGAFLLFAGWQACNHTEEDIKGISLSQHLKKWLPATETLDGEKFFIKNASNSFVATPLFLCLVAIELSDILFAIDSIPAILAITTDPFIVFTSNVFAILGLRSLYFTIQNLLKKISALHYGIGALLMFVGTKFLIAPWIHIPILVSLGIIATIIIITLVLSPKLK